MSEALPIPHAGVLAARTLRAHDADTVFTLNGAHIWLLYDGCVREGVRLVDTRHEQTAAFAAEGWAKVTRRVGVTALTAGPGVTNGISAITSAWLNGTPVFVVGGRAPAGRWGQGSLQELDHVPLVAPITKYAATAVSADDVPGAFDHAFARGANATPRSDVHRRSPRSLGSYRSRGDRAGWASGGGRRASGPGRDRARK